MAQATRCTEIERKDVYSVQVRVWIGTSRIAGKGLFAAQDIKKGTRLMQYIGQRMTKAETTERFHHCLSQRSGCIVTRETDMANTTRSRCIRRLNTSPIPFSSRYDNVRCPIVRTRLLRVC
jgi:hypothetical protein